MNKTVISSFLCGIIVTISVIILARFLWKVINCWYPGEFDFDVYVPLFISILSLFVSTSFMFIQASAGIEKEQEQEESNEIKEKENIDKLQEIKRSIEELKDKLDSAELIFHK